MARTRRLTRCIFWLAVTGGLLTLSAVFPERQLRAGHVPASEHALAAGDEDF